MFGKVFYNKTFRTYINGFGTLFNDILIAQYDADDNIINKIKVPIIYSSKEQWFSKIKDPEKAEAARTLPLIAFIQNGITRLDDRRTAQKSEKVMLESEDKNFAVEMGQDWELLIKMSIMAGNQTEIDQILEQIMHYFDPSFTIKLILLKDTIDYLHEVPITLTDIAEDENNFAGEATRRRIIYTLNFKLVAKHFGPVYVNADLDLTTLPFDVIKKPKSLGETITRVIIDQHSGGNTGEAYVYQELQMFPRDFRILLTVDGQNIIETTENFYDGKIRNILPDPLDVDANSLT